MALTIATLNVNGIAESPKRTKVFEFLKTRNINIYLLQETHLSDVKVSFGENNGAVTPCGLQAHITGLSVK